MAKEVSTKRKGVSLDPDDAESGGGGFGPGPAKAIKHKFGFFDYQGKRKPVPAMLVTFSRDGEKSIEAYTVGKGWKPSADGLEIIPTQGQTGLRSNCKAMLYITALKEHAQMPKGFMRDHRIDALDGIAGNLVRQALEAIEDDKGGEKKAGSVLVFDELSKAPWRLSGRKKQDDEAEEEEEDEAEDEEEEEEEEDDDEPPAKKGKKKPAEDEAEDEDEPESEDEDEDEDQVEAGVEALIAALENGPLKIDKIEGAVLDQLKRHKDRKAIAKLVASEKFAAKEKGWDYDKKKKVVSLAD